MKITISGAGLVGSLWALFMARRGYAVDVYERRPDMRRGGVAGGRSINLAMSVRGWRALDLAGVKDDILNDAIPMKGRMMHSVSGGLTFQPYGKEDEAIYSVSRGGLNHRLVDLAESHPNVRFHFNHRCERFDARSGQITFLDTDTDERLHPEADFIFGCDGAFSAIRNGMQRTDRFNYSQHYLPHGYKELHIPPTDSGDFAMEAHALHIWPRGEFMLIALPNPDKSFTCTLFLPFSGGASFEGLRTDGQIGAFFKTYFPDVISIMPGLLEDFKQNPTASLVTIRCTPWQWRNKVLLMGDASHAIVPFYGQGMNSGFEDCSLLHALGDKYEGDWGRAIAEFSDTRPKDADAIADLALRNFVEMRDLVGDPKFLLRKKIAAWLHDRFPDRFLALYGLVTFSHTPYSEALAEGRKQDRMFREILELPGIMTEDWRGNDEVLRIFNEFYGA